MILLPAKRNVIGWMVLPLRRYADFNGRSGRREFWLYCLFLFLGYLAIFVLAIAAIVVNEALEDDITGFGLFGGWGLFFLANFVPGLALTVRRLHDMDLSGWLLLAIFGALLFFNVLGWIGYLVSMSVPGKATPNRHGPPVGEENTAEIFA